MKRPTNSGCLIAIAGAAAFACTAASAANLVQGGDFDSSADVTSFWTAGANSSISWTANDVDASVASGSINVALAANKPTVPVPAGFAVSALATQCLANVTAGDHNFRAMVFGGSNSGGSMELDVFDAGTNCGGNKRQALVSNVTSANDSFAWTPVTGAVALDTTSDVLAVLNFYNEAPPRPDSVVQGFSQAVEFDSVFVQGDTTPVRLQNFSVD